jgi:hypothetical protein
MRAAFTGNDQNRTISQGRYGGTLLESVTFSVTCVRYLTSPAIVGSKQFGVRGEERSELRTMRREEGGCRGTLVGRERGRDGLIREGERGRRKQIL